MSTHRSHVKFQGHSHELSGIIGRPKDTPIGYVLYAHCFTCGKDFNTSSRIARGLVKKGFAVFRFDFTGIGSSKGDFSDTNFTSNVQDIIAAVDFMRIHLKAPDLMIGHSLGGTATIKASESIPEAKAVVCISSPAHANHIEHLFKDKVAEIKSQGQASVGLGGRELVIKKQFLDDLENQKTSHIGKIDKALLVMHSPLDNVVAIEEAEKIYVKAKHPKSFVSLDSADHLLTNKSDVQYAVDVISAWSNRFL